MFHYRNITRKMPKKNDSNFIYTESGNIPQWAKNEKDFWQVLSKKELENDELFQKGIVGKKRRTVRKFIFALPNEMTHKEMIQFTRSYLENNFKEFPYTFAIREKFSAIHKISNPHVQFIFADYINNDRSNNLDKDTYFKMHGISKAGREYGGAQRSRRFSFNHTTIQNIRKDLADRINSYYENKGIDKRVSDKSLKAQRKDALEKKDFKTASIMNRGKPIRLNYLKFEKYKHEIKEKVVSGWKNISDLNDIKDNKVKERIIQELDKQIKEELMH